MSNGPQLASGSSFPSIRSRQHWASLTFSGTASIQKSTWPEPFSCIARSYIKVMQHALRRVFFTRHGAQISDGADLIVRRRGREELARAVTEKEAGHMAVRGEDAYEIIPEVAPQILFGRVWGYVMQTDDVIAWLTTGEAPKRTRLPA